MSDDLVGAGISPKERLERIEAMLVKIDDKLDNKVEMTLFTQLDQRVRTIEMLGSIQAQEAEKGVLQTQEKVEALRGIVYKAMGAVSAIVLFTNILLYILSHR